jgi:hypothetical protein
MRKPSMGPSSGSSSSGGKKRKLSSEVTPAENEREGRGCGRDLGSLPLPRHSRTSRLELEQLGPNPKVPRTVPQLQFIREIGIQDRGALGHRNVTNL